MASLAAAIVPHAASFYRIIWTSPLHALRVDPEFQDTPVVAVTATTYAEEALLRNGGHFSFTRSAGISTGNVLDLIQSSLQVLRPDYTTDADPPGD